MSSDLARAAFWPLRAGAAILCKFRTRRSALSVTSEHVFVCRRYVSMESFAISAPVARSDGVDPGGASPGHQGSSTFVTIWNGKG